MKFNHFFVIMLLVNAASMLQAQPVIMEMGAARIAPTDIRLGCECYCSEKCGPRKATTADNPFIDPETGICFCQQWDKDNYVANGCVGKNLDFETCCGTSGAVSVEGSAIDY